MRTTWVQHKYSYITYISNEEEIILKILPNKSMILTTILQQNEKKKGGEREREREREMNKTETGIILMSDEVNLKSSKTPQLYIQNCNLYTSLNN